MKDKNFCPRRETTNRVKQQLRGWEKMPAAKHISNIKGSYTTWKQKFQIVLQRA